MAIKPDAKVSTIKISRFEELVFNLAEVSISLVAVS